VKEGTTFIGLDAIQVCLLRSNREEPLEWQVVNEPGAVRRMAKKILKEAQGEVLSCYEAGPCGYALQRQLRGAGVTCHQSGAGNPNISGAFGVTNDMKPSITS